jgi:uncharacterized membrane protein
MSTTIRNPVEWGMDQVRQAAQRAEAAGRGMRHVQERMHSPAPAIKQIGLRDLGEALAEGIDDFGTYRTDVIFLCLFYPVIGLILGRAALGSGMLPLLFPLAAGFALIGPFAAIGLYEMSRQREANGSVSWATAFDVARAPSFAGVVTLGVLLIAIFLLWLAAAWGIFALTLGPAQPASLGHFLSEIFTTGAGWAMIGLGIGVGFLFALLVLAIGTVSFPLLMDRDIGVDTAIATSFRVCARNPGPMAVWGLIVTGGLVIGTIPLLLGLIIVLPVLGHATWHLYRRVIVA